MSKSKSDWETLFALVEKVRPDYGKLTCDLIYHQGVISKVIFTQKQDTFVLNKVESVKKQGE